MGLLPLMSNGRSPARRVLFSIPAILLLPIAVQASTLPAAFKGVSLDRSVKVSGYLGAFDMFGGDSAVETFEDGQNSQDLASGTMRTGMAFALPYHDYFFGNGDGQAAVTSQLGSQSISFEAVADVSMSGYGSHPYALDSNGDAEVKVTYTFTLTSSQAVWLGLNSHVRDFREDDFSFSLSRHHPDGPVKVWDETVMLDEHGEAQRSFSQLLSLEAGEYVVSTRLSADSASTGDIAYSGRTWAQVTLKPHVTHAPEPASWALGVAGVGLVGWWTRRTKAARRSTDTGQVVA